MRCTATNLIIYLYDLICVQLEPDLDSDVAVVLGHGNVALDVVRILLNPVDVLKVP